MWSQHLVTRNLARVGTQHVRDRNDAQHEERRDGATNRRLDPAGGLWVAWPKQASGVATDVNGNIVREAVLTSGLVDNKICAIDETWSGLRGVVRHPSSTKGDTWDREANSFYVRYFSSITPR